uniref:Uncharacterized protein n=1 Tax=Geospiza parvula TaxID=87175 RepID=A0A8C3MRC5_GEOPR
MFSSLVRYFCKPQGDNPTGNPPFNLTLLGDVQVRPLWGSSTARRETFGVVRPQELFAYAGCKLCPQDWQLHGERCYWLSEELGNWTQGMKSCENQDSQLVVLQDKKEKVNREKKIWRVSSSSAIQFLFYRLGTSLHEMDEGCGTLRGKDFEVKRCDAEHKWVCKKKPFLLCSVTAEDGEKSDASI